MLTSAASNNWVADAGLPPVPDFDLSPISTLLLDAETRQIRAANCAAELLYGYTGDELLRLRFDDLIAGDAARVAIATRTLADGSTVETEVQRHQRRDGTVFPALCASRVVVREGSKVHVISSFDADDLAIREVLDVESPVPEATRVHHETILVVDDEPMVRAPICRTLRRCGYDVLEAGDGEEALRVMQEHHEPIPLLISDDMMPELRGTELIAMLHSWYPRMRVLLISGYQAERVAEREELAASHSFLAKPFTMNALTERVRELLDSD